MKKILVVDDNPDMRRLVHETLKKSYDLKLVGTGKECLSEVQSFSPDLIILDIMLPDMDGYNIASELKLKEKSYFEKPSRVKREKKNLAILRQRYQTQKEKENN